MTIEIRIGRYRLISLPASRQSVPEFPTIHRIEAPSAGEENALLASLSGIEQLPEAVRQWLAEHVPGWRLTKRQRMQSGNIARQETVLQIETEKAARAFEAVWAAWLRERFLADLQVDAEACRRLADDAFDRFVRASPGAVSGAAFEVLVAERLLGWAVAAVVRFEGFVTAPGWYRVRVRHVRPFGVHFAVIPPNRERRRAEKLGLTEPRIELEPICLRCRPHEVRIGHWQRLRIRGSSYSIDRTPTATKSAFDNAGGYISIYKPRADDAFLFERHIPPAIEFLPGEIVDWLNHHAPGWRFIDRRRAAFRNVVYQDVVLEFDGPIQAEAFRLCWGGILVPTA